MTRYDIVPATEAHALEMAPTMREADVLEVWATSHSSPEEALLDSIHGSSVARAGLADGRVICAYGVGELSLVSDEGIPWLLTAEELGSHSRAFLRGCRAFVAEIRPRYRVLASYVDARHAVAVRWLRWLGFEILPAHPFGVDQLPFHPFRMGGGRWAN